MAYDDDFGAAFTGQRAPGVAPLQNIMAPAPQTQPAGFFDDPNNIAALLSFGIGAAQPMDWGQTTTGHILGALGGAGETLSQRQKEDIAQQQADVKAQRAEDLYNIAQQRADIAERKGLTGAVKGMTEYQRLNAERADRREAEREAREADKDLLARAGELVEDPFTGDKKSPYFGKKQHEIYDILKAQRAAPGAAPAAPAGGVPTATDPKTGNKVFYRGNQWVDVNGKPVQ